MKQLAILIFLPFFIIHSVAVKADDSLITGPYLSLGANGFLFDSEHNLEDDTTLFIDLGYQINNHWAAEFLYTELSSELSAFPNTDWDLDFWSVAAVHRLAPRQSDSLFYKGGLGNYDSTLDSEDLIAQLGIGYDFAINNNLSFVAGADAIVGIDESRLDWRPYLKLSYFFGKTAAKAVQPAPKPAPTPEPVKPKDSDNDGVIDDLDQCPKTPSGAAVDSKGCELDSDNDTVKDSADQCPNTPQGAKVDERGCRVILKEDVSITLNVQFANNSNVVTDDYRDEIAKVANFMRQYPDTKVTIEGHTDSSGSAVYNQQLSQRRAEAVMNYLIANFSIPANRLQAVGKGESSPIADNNTREGRRANRRVQAEIKTTVIKN